MEQYRTFKRLLYFRMLWDCWTIWDRLLLTNVFLVLSALARKRGAREQSFAETKLRCHLINGWIRLRHTVDNNDGNLTTHHDRSPLQ
jgi:hypothetical protein